MCRRTRVPRPTTGLARIGLLVVALDLALVLAFDLVSCDGSQGVEALLIHLEEPDPEVASVAVFRAPGDLALHDDLRAAPFEATHQRLSNLG